MFAIAMVPFPAGDVPATFAPVGEQLTGVGGGVVRLSALEHPEARLARPALVHAGFCTQLRAVLDVWAIVLSLKKSRNLTANCHRLLAGRIGSELGRKQRSEPEGNLFLYHFLS
jgi:hypothetical protein